MNLGANSNPSALAAAILNFLVVFGVQVIFKVEEIINQNRYPDFFECLKIAVNSLTVTIVFYGYNKLKTSEAK